MRITSEENTEQYDISVNLQALVSDKLIKGMFEILDSLYVTGVVNKA